MANFIDELIANGKLTRNNADFLSDSLIRLTDEYSFLKISPELWLRVFRQVALDYKVIEVNKYVYAIRKRVINVITTNCAKQNTSILDAYLNKVKGSSYKRTLNMFFKFVKDYRIKFDEVYFQKLKDNSPFFKEIIDSFGANDFSFKQVCDLIYGKYDLEISLRPRGKDLNWVINTLTYVLNIMGITDLSWVKSEQFYKTEYYKKIKMILSKYDSILNMHDDYEKIIGKYSLRKFHTIIFSLNLDKMKTLFDDYIRYNSLKETKDKDIGVFKYLQSLLSKYQSVNVDEKVIVTPKVPKEEEKHEEKKVVRQKKYKNIYEYILKGEELTSQKKQLIDNIFSSMPKDIQELIIEYFAGNIVSNRNINYNLSNIRNKYLAQLQGSSKRGRYRDIYEYVLGDDSTNQDKRKILLGLLARYEIEKINLYFAKKLDDKEKAKVRALMARIRNEYLIFEESDNSIMAKNYQGVDEYLLDDTQDLENIEMLEEFLTSENIDELNAYFKKTLPLNKRFEVNKKLEKLKLDFKKLLMTKKKSKKENNELLFDDIYSYILREDANNKKRRKIVDNLLATQSKEIQQEIKDYYAKKDLGRDRRYIVQRRLSYLRYKYYHNILPTLETSKKRGFRNVYEYVLREDAQDAEKRKIVDRLLKSRSLETLQSFDDYFNRRITDEKLKHNACNNLTVLRKSYLSLINDEKIRKRGAKDIYEYILKEDFKDLEKREMVDQLLKLYPQEFLDDIEDYFNKRITDKKLRQKVGSKLQNLRSKYLRLLENNIKRQGFLDIYEYMLRDDAQNIESREMLDQFLKTLSKEYYQRIEAYFNRTLTDTQKRRAISGNLHILRERYLKYKENNGEIKETIYKNIYEYILREDVHDLEKRAIVDQILKTQSIDILNIIEGYFNKTVTDKELRKKASSKMYFLRERYLKYISDKKKKPLTKNGKYRNVYEYILREDAQDLGKRAIVDQVLSSQSIDILNNIEVYFSKGIEDKKLRCKISYKLHYLREKCLGILYNTRDMYKEIYNLLLAYCNYSYLEVDEFLAKENPEELNRIELNLQNNYVNRELLNSLQNRLIEHLYLKNKIYTVFPKENFNLIIANILIRNLDEKERIILNKYLENGEDNPLVKRIIKLLNKSYDYYLKYNVLPNYYYLENVFMSIDLEWFRKEYFKLSKTKIDLYKEALVLLEYRYIILDTDIDFKTYLKMKIEEARTLGLGIEELFNEIKEDIIEKGYVK